jgi:dienelactone hydrolase
MLRTIKSVFIAALVACTIGATALTAFAQADKKKGKIAPPKDETLVTTDGVNLRVTWYEGSAKKETVPIIMVHGWEGSRGEYDTLARGLQGLGHSIIVPDLRGHGDSKTQKLPNGESKTLDLGSLRPQDQEAMTRDLEACKRWLIEKNNAGECNIETLCLIGSEFGAVLAMHYAALDWSVPNLPAYKQGQDVKALVLLSPSQKEKALSVRDALAQPAVQKTISIMIVSGRQDSKGTAEAKRLHKSLEVHHPKPPADRDEQMKKQDLFLVQPETSLTGTKLLGSGLKVAQNIATFIDWRLVKRQNEFPWAERKSPL